MEAPVNCKLPEKMNFSGRLDLQKALSQRRGQNGFELVLDAGAVQISGSLTTRKCSSYRTVDRTTVMDTECRKYAVSEKTLSRHVDAIAGLLGFKPSCMAKNPALVAQASEADYYYGSQLRCTVPNKKFKMDVESLPTELEKEGLHGVSVSKGKNGYRIASEIPTVGCSQFDPMRVSSEPKSVVAPAAQ